MGPMARQSRSLVRQSAPIVGQSGPIVGPKKLSLVAKPLQNGHLRLFGDFCPVPLIRAAIKRAKSTTACTPAIQVQLDWVGAAHNHDPRRRARRSRSPRNPAG
jgi:hypothetical protein